MIPREEEVYLDVHVGLGEGLKLLAQFRRSPLL